MTITRLFALAALIAIPLGTFAAEAEWKARFDAINEARMASTDMADYEKSQARFAELATDLEAAVKEELAKGQDRAELAAAAYWLASTYLYLQRYQQAAVMLRIAMEIRVKRFGEQSLEVAEVWDKVAWLGDDPDKSAAVMRKALAIREKVYGAQDPRIVPTLRDIGMNRLTSRHYEEAETMYDRAIAIVEKARGKDHPDVVEPVSDLGWLRIIEHRPEEAIPLYRRALAIVEKSVAAGDDDRIAQALENLAHAYADAKRYDDGEATYLRAIAMREKLHGPNHMLTITAMGRLRDIYIIQGRTIDSWKLGRKIEAAQGL